ncbi:MAG: hypothetical protein LBU65_07350 [Planctomycetaceae bacterium]|nr:hypothetical protein [Planctomycetaceae bacterium]
MLEVAKKYIYHVNSGFLQKYSNFVFVDMPGFDSDNGGHDKAIAAYVADSGNAYILCVNCEDGTIRDSVLSGLREIRNYTQNLACAVTKTDKLPNEHIASVCQSIKSAAESCFNEKISVDAVSVNDDSPSIIIPKLLTAFDINNLFKQKFVPEIAVICGMIQNALTTTKRLSDSYDAQSEQSIRKLLKEKKNIERIFDTERKKLKKLFEQSKAAILEDVQTALNNNVSTLVPAAKTGNATFSKAVTDIVRPVLVSSIRHNTNKKVETFIEQIDVVADLQNIGGVDFDVKLIGDVLKNSLLRRQKWQDVMNLSKW